MNVTCPSHFGEGFSGRLALTVRSSKAVGLGPHVQTVRSRGAEPAPGGGRVSQPTINGMSCRATASDGSVAAVLGHHDHLAYANRVHPDPLMRGVERGYSPALGPLYRCSRRAEP